MCSVSFILESPLEELYFMKGMHFPDICDDSHAIHVAVDNLNFICSQPLYFSFLIVARIHNSYVTLVHENIVKVELSTFDE